MIFNIQRFSTHDGEGIRTNIFLKGCPLRCEWCSNPESQSYKAEILFDPAKCIGCGTCVDMSQNGEFTKEDGQVVYNSSECTRPELFRDICPSKAIEVVGEDLEVEEIMAIIEKDRLFYEKKVAEVLLSQVVKH